MADIMKVWLSKSQMSSLGKALNTVLSPISPLRWPSELPEEEAVAQLRETGIIEGTGTVAPQYREALQVLAAPEAFARLRLTRGRGLIEYVVYFAGNGNTCALLTHNEGFFMEYTAAVDEMTLLVEQLAGTSSLKSADFTGTFDHLQGMALAAVIDLTRQAMLRAVINPAGPFSADYNLDEIEKWLGGPGNDAQWLTAVIRGIVPGLALQRSDLENAVEGLAERGFLLKNNDKYALDENTAMLASRLLLLDKILSMRTGRLQQSAVVQAGFVCLIAGVNDALMIEAGEKSLYMETISTREVCDITGAALREPMAASPTGETAGGTKEPAAAREQGQKTAAETAAPPPAQGGSQALICASCGTALIQGAKFCPSCGTPVQNLPRFCASCGAEIPPGAVFCGNCGAPVPRG